MRYFSLAVLLFAGMAASANAGPSMGMIHGRVVVRGTNQPVCGVMVTADSDRQPPVHTRTLHNGTYNFYSIIPGKERVTVGRHLEAVYVTVSANLTTTDAPTMYLRRMPHSIRCAP